MTTHLIGSRNMLGRGVKVRTSYGTTTKSRSEYGKQQTSDRLAGNHSGYRQEDCGLPQEARRHDS